MPGAGYGAIHDNAESKASVPMDDMAAKARNHPVNKGPPKKLVDSDKWAIQKTNSASFGTTSALEWNNPMNQVMHGQISI